ncbi:acetyl-CoA carboxylase biotin carboxyl carrier protein subunit [Crocinitomix algicola]|uniref:acetyl-CoA carboxylase biotin carboxyl carrier protein subunit n=1 Tax=Crocinitomix algicola TaxID=1740263 RepID=UPI000872DAB0|nr:acetyl-CoA carboxylase biotin carboxyl carrier protein subunit [Crocinitomix algicola]
MLNTINTIELEKKIADYNIKQLNGDVYQIEKLGEKAEIIEVLNVDIALKTMTIRHNHSVHDLVFKNNLDFVLDKMGIKRATDNISTSINAPMPGKVIGILVKEGDQVAKGDGILILEAMKMENVLKAEHDCSIKKIVVEEAVSVEKNQVLIELA